MLCQCGTVNHNGNKKCVFCKIPIPEDLPLDDIDKLTTDIEIYRLRMFEMTPQEELFAKFFNGEKALVANMNDLELRAHREELSHIAFEARARLTAINEEGQERNSKRKLKNNQVSLETDSETSEAINRIKERQKKLTKTEKLIENLMKLPGIDRQTAEKMVSATTQLEIRNKKETPSAAEKETSIKTINNSFSKSTESKAEKEKPKTFINPFGK